MKPLESLTVEDLAALCGLERDSQGDWLGEQPWQTNPCVLIYSVRCNTWSAFGIGGRTIVEDVPEHAALVALAQHLNLTPKEEPMNPTRYTRIERDPKTDDYTGYEPKDGDRWCFGRGVVWSVVHTGSGAYVKANEVDYYGALSPLRSLTTHIERPIRVVTVPKEGYVPQVGDRFCGPDGVVFTLSGSRIGWRFEADGGGFDLLSIENVRRLAALATRIERDA